ESKMKPLPTPLAPVRSSAVVAILTTAGMAWFTALMTAEDSSMVTLLTLVPTGAGLPAGEAVSSRRWFATAAAERPPDRIPTTMAMATTPQAPGPRRTGGGDAGGRVGHEPAAHEGGGAVW